MKSGQKITLLTSCMPDYNDYNTLIDMKKCKNNIYNEHNGYTAIAEKSNPINHFIDANYIDCHNHRKPYYDTSNNNNSGSSNNNMYVCKYIRPVPISRTRCDFYRGT